jgi:hypothetical protein
MHKSIEPEASEMPNWLSLLDRMRARVALTSSAIADGSSVSVRDLEIALLLHLPRFELWALESESTFTNEAKRLFGRMQQARRNYYHWANRPKITEFHKSEVHFAACSIEIAQAIYEKFHYIGACREGVAHLGLFHDSFPEIPMALMTLSEMDIQHLSHLFEDEANQALVVSRSYAFDWAPRNSISFLTSRVKEWVRRSAPSTRLLFTYVNPNLGFKGTSYDASGWRVFGWKDTRYRYFHDNYVTYRDMLRLSPHERRQITTSRVKLAPLNLLATSIEGGRENIVDFNIR